LPQPEGFGDDSVEAQHGLAGSHLEMYKEALRLRHQLQTGDESVEWLNADDGAVVHFRRSNGWECVVNFSGAFKPLPNGRGLISSHPLANDGLPGDTALWLTPDR
jgi:alpha-glucosidase